jgi:hypothetical protein
MSGKRKWEKIQSKIARIAVWQSLDRKRTITDLSRAIEELIVEGKRPGEGILALARELARQWKVKGRPMLEGIEIERLVLLVALVVVLRRDQELHELTETFRRLFPEEHKKLSGDGSHAEAVRVAPSEASIKLSRKRKYEEKRSRHNRNFFQSIEYQFGGEGEEKWRTSLMSWSGVAYEPTCLDKVLRGGVVGMRQLENFFFGIGRHRLARLVDREDKKRGEYGIRAVAKIAAGLLQERPQKARKRRKPGRPRGEPWLNDVELRARVKSGIERRIVSIAKELLSTDQDKALRWWKSVAEPFLSIVGSSKGSKGVGI